MPTRACTPPSAGARREGPGAARLGDADLARRGRAARHPRGRRGPRRGPGLPQRLRAPGRPRRADHAPAAARLRARRASASSCSAPSTATTARSTAASPRSPTASASRAWRRATSTRTRPRARGCRTPSWPSASTRRSTPPSRCAAATTATSSPRRRRWPRASPTTPRRSPRPSAWPTPCASTSPATSATATPAPRTPRPTASWPRSATACFEARYPMGSPLRGEAAARLEEELRLIATLGLSGFFLLHREMLELARDVAVEVRGPRHRRARCCRPGAGAGRRCPRSSATSPGLSHVDPIANKLLLGRFLNEEISTLPDIDLDFPRDVREVLIPRVHDRFGRDRAALVAAFPTFRARGAIRELGKALGLPPGEIERVARGSEGWHGEDVDRDIATALGAGREAEGRWRWLGALAEEAHGLPRHLSQHSGGMIVATRPLIDCCPVVPAAMEGRQMVMWDKDSCSDAGFLKIDLLGLGMLSSVERCVELVAARRGERIDLSRIPYDDPRHLPGHPGGRDHRRLPDREPRADGLAAAHAPREPRRPHHPGGDRAPGADPGRRGQPLHRAPPAPARGARLRDPLRPPLARARPARHAGDDHLPGPGHRGLDGLLGLLAGRGRGPAPRDEPQALGRGDRGPPPRLRRGRDGQVARRRRGAGRARVVDGRRLLGLRLPQGPRRRLRPAGLPVDLAARPLRARVPVLAARRAADGLLSARRPRPRGPAPRHRGPPARRQRQRGRLHRRRRPGGGPALPPPRSRAAPSAPRRTFPRRARRPLRRPRPTLGRCRPRSAPAPPPHRPRPARAHGRRSRSRGRPPRPRLRPRRARRRGRRARRGPRGRRPLPLARRPRGARGRRSPGAGPAGVVGRLRRPGRRAPAGAVAPGRRRARPRGGRGGHAALARARAARGARAGRRSTTGTR